MKVYVVTSGSYSDYHINKVFTNKTKAEEYAEWHYNWDGTHVEEYDTEDDFVVDKYYDIRIHAKVYPNGVLGPDVKITKRDEMQHYNWLYNYSDHFELTIVRSVSLANWDEDFYVKKYTKSLYDLIAIVKYHMANGTNVSDIEKLIRGYNEVE